MSAPHGTGQETGALCAVTGHCLCLHPWCCWCGKKMQRTPEPWQKDGDEKNASSVPQGESPEQRA